MVKKNYCKKRLSSERSLFFACVHACSSSSSSSLSTTFDCQLLYAIYQTEDLNKKKEMLEQPPEMAAIFNQNHLFVVWGVLLHVDMSGVMMNNFRARFFVSSVAKWRLRLVGKICSFGPSLFSRMEGVLR